MKTEAIMDQWKWYALASDGDTAEISIFNEIGYWGITVSDFKAEFDEIRDSKSIKVLLNSPGGDVSEGISLYNLLSGVRSKLTVEVMGIAASAASVIALAGKELVMGEGTYLMIHDPWGIAMGNADDMLKMADVLEKMRGQFAEIYAKHSNLSKDEALAAMADETWYTAQEAVDAGFADSVIEYEEKAAAITFDGARRRVIESMINMKLEMSRLKRETEGALRDAGLSRSVAETETARIFSDHRDDGAETQGDPETRPKVDPKGRRSRGIDTDLNYCLRRQS